MHHKQAYAIALAQNVKCMSASCCAGNELLQGTT